MNVLLVSVDTTRADCLACYGHPIVKTPHIDRLAAEGTRFAWCISSAPLTLVSHSTMLTGSYPFVHGARDNGLYRLSDENVTLAEIFNTNGYDTRAEVAALVLNQAFGLDQGFDSYGDVSPAEEEYGADTFTMAAGGRRERAKPGAAAPMGDACEEHLERKADVITRRGIELLTLASKREKPFFMFLHYFDPHQPHEAPERFASQYQDGYFAEISFFDEQFGKLMDAVHELKLDTKTLVVLTSDHGEGRGQHGEYTHSAFLYDATQHVPLILWAPGQVPAGKVVQDQVRHIDIAPTVMEFTRLERTPQMHGDSLMPLLEGRAGKADRPAYSDTMVPRNTYGYSPLRSLRAGGWKYILSPKPELYHVAEDPLELINLASQEPQRSAEMREQLRSVIAEAPPPPGRRANAVTVDESNLEKLESLGYVSGNAPKGKDDPLLSGSELDDFEPKGENPRDHVEAMEAMAAGMGAFRIGIYEEAEKAMRRLLELAPENPTGMSYLAAALKRQFKYDEAITLLRRAVELNPERWRDQRMLGTMLAERGEYLEAEIFLQKAIDGNLEDPISHINMGQLQVLLQRYPAAIKELIAAAALAPRMADARFHLGNAYRLNGQPEEAVQEFQEALRLKPTMIPAYLQLSGALTSRGCLDEAIEFLKQAVELLPNRPSLFHALAECYERKGDLAQAGVQLEHMVGLDGRAEAYNEWAANQLAQGNNAGAVSALDAAAEAEPDHVATHLRLASALQMMGRTREAVDRLAEGVQANPESPALHRAMGDILSEIGELDRAGEHYARVVELAPNRAAAWRNLGVNLLMRGRSAEAIERLQKSLEIDANAPDTLGPLAEALRESGESEAAARTYQRLIQVAPRRAAGYLGWAGLLDDRGEPARAVDVLRRGAAALPESAEIANDLAWRLATTSQEGIHDAAAALRLAERANQLTGGGNVAVLDTLAAAYAASARFDEAVKTAERAMESARQANDPALAERIAARRDLYAKQQPYREQ